MRKIFHIYCFFKLIELNYGEIFVAAKLGISVGGKILLATIGYIETDEIFNGCDLQLLQKLNSIVRYFAAYHHHGI